MKIGKPMHEPDTPFRRYLSRSIKNLPLFFVAKGRKGCGDSSVIPAPTLPARPPQKPSNSKQTLDSSAARSSQKGSIPFPKTTEIVCFTRDVNEVANEELELFIGSPSKN